MSLEALSNPEKKKTSAELAIDHINLELEKIERELQGDKIWGRVWEIGGGATMIVGVVSAALLLESWGRRGISQELVSALQNFDFSQLNSLSG